jgi:hypothetical protein
MSMNKPHNSWLVAALMLVMLVALSASIPSASALISPSKVIAYYSFDDGSAITANDSSTNRYNGNISGGSVLAGGKIGQAYNFNVTSYINITNFDFAGNYSFCAWVYIIGNGGGGLGRFFDNGNTSLMNQNTTDTSPVTYFMRVSVNGTTADDQSRHNVTSLDWHFLCLAMRTTSTGNAETFLYRDGVAGNNNTFTKVFLPGSENMYIGNRKAGDRGFNGSLDEVSFWNITLTFSQIVELYAGGSGFQYPFAYSYPYFAEDTISTSSYLGDTSTIQLNCTTPGGALTYTENSPYSTISSTGLLTLTSAMTDVPAIYTITASCSNGTTIGNATITFNLQYPASGRTFYFSSVTGSDSNNGLTTATAFKSIAKMNTLSLVPGDNVLFARGGFWRMTTDAFPSFTSGNSSAYITYGAYGTGAKPEFWASINLSATSNWTEESTNIWVTTGQWQKKLGILVFNNEQIPVGDMNWSKANLASQGMWEYNSSDNGVSSENLTYIYSVGNPGTYYTSIEAGSTTSGNPKNDGAAFYLSGKSHIIIANWSSRYAAVLGLEGGYSNDIQILDSAWRLQGGAFQENSPDYGPRPYGACIQFWVNSSNILISGNNFSECFDVAVTPQASSYSGTALMENITIINNLVTNTREGIIEFFNSNITSTTKNILIDHNTIVWDSSLYRASRRITSFVRFAALGANYTGYFNYTNNVHICGNDIHACVFFENSPPYTWAGPQPVFDYNFYNKTTAGVNITSWGNGTTQRHYATLDSFRAAFGVGLEVHGIQGVPSFVSGLYIPRTESSICTMSNTGSYVGAFPCTDVSPTTYYVDATSGADSNDGLTPATAIKTIAKMNTIALYPGDSVLFKRGETWRMTTDAFPTFTSGDSTARIIYNAYGTGVAPIFDASINLSTLSNWTQDPTTNTTMWRLNGTWSSKIGNLILNDDTLYNSNLIYKKSDVNKSGEWHYNTTENKIYWNISANPASIYTDIYATTSPDDARVINLAGMSYITLANWSIRRASIHGIQLGRADHIKILECSFDAIGGAWQNAATRYGNCIENYGNGTNFEISHNTFSNCYDAAISPQFTSTSATIFENLTYQYNLIIDSRYPFEYFNTNESSIVKNILFDHNTIISAQNKFMLRTSSWLRLAQSNCTVTNFNITNNVFIGGNTTGAIAYSFNETNDWWNGVSPNLNYNFFNKTNPATNLLRFNAVVYTSLAAFKTAQPNFEVNSIQGVPSFVVGSYVPTSDSPICTMSDTGSYVGAYPCASTAAVAIVEENPCRVQFSGYSGTYDVTYTYATNSQAYTALGRIISTFTTLPTWFGIMLVVAFAMTIIGLFAFFRQGSY